MLQFSHDLRQRVLSLAFVPCSCRRPGLSHRYGTERNSQGLHNRSANNQKTEEAHAGDRGCRAGGFGFDRSHSGAGWQDHL
jgi:hypothetical protein